jgi:hypothetical protein
MADQRPVLTSAWVVIALTALGYELEVITMVVLGGVSTLGGKGRMAGPLLAIFIIGFLNYGLGLQHPGADAADHRRPAADRLGARSTYAFAADSIARCSPPAPGKNTSAERS